jgi:hypothetical protein
VAIPNVTVELNIPGLGWRDVSGPASIDSTIEVTEAIENPTEVNAFVAPEVTIKLHQDGSGIFTFSLFSSMLPESTDYLVRIKRDGVTLFYGFILPNTLQFDDAERWASFNAIGMAGKLARTSAESSAALKRAVNTGWRVHEAGGNESLGTVIITNTAGATSLCEILAGDTVTVQTPGGQTDELVVQGVAPTTETSPHLYFELTVTGLNQAYEAGSVVTLITPYARNLSLKTFVDRLFLAAGLNATTASTYLAAPLVGASAPFATPPSMVGLEGIAPLGVSTVTNDIIGSPLPGEFPVLGTNVGVYKQENAPTGDWTFYEHADTALYPVDWRPYGSGKWEQYGRRYRRRLIRDAELPPNVTGALYTFWAYDYYDTFTPATFYRYRLEVEVDNFDGRAAAYNWETRLYKESSSDGYTWTTIGGPYGTRNGVTVARLHDEIPYACGIEVFKLLGSKRIIFTDPDDTVDPCQYYLSQMTTAGAVTRNVGPSGVSIRGNLFQHKLDYLLVARRDTTRSDIPTAFILTDDGAGALAVSNTVPIPADFQPYTLRYNAGDGYWYALASSKENGVRLLSFTGSTLALRSGYTPPELFPPSGALGAVDMTVVNGPPGQTYPMLAIFGNQLWWISKSASGWIAYADVEGLSCGEALAQAVTLVDAYAYVDRDLTSWVKSRGTTSTRSVITGTTGTSTRLDDGGCLRLRRSSIWYKSYRYVTVKNEKDESIVGEAGDKNFKDTEQGLELTSRYVSTQSFATALAQNLLSYLGRALKAVDLEHELDERRYEIGRWFNASIDGAVRTFQIIEATPRPVAGTVRVQGLEL